ncbi:MAG: S1C family serine protease [Lachnospiraceae bacterium]|nr:S1C family serine protease [Lachnospiraceae bacterium]
MEERKNNPDPEFLKEKLKQRPLNRRKLLRRVLLTVLMAIIFGTVATVTIILMEPVISEYLYPADEDEPELIVFPADIIEEEILPEDMIADEREMQELQLALEAEDNPPPDIDEDDLEDFIRWIASDVMNKKVFGIAEYISINRSLMEISKEAQKSLVVVTGVTEDENWIRNVFENKIQTTGVIVWSSETDFLILANITSIINADSIMLTFVNGNQYPAEIRQYDRTTGFAILSVSHTELSAGTVSAIQAIEIGNSASLSIKGLPVIAVGRIINNADSTCYGFITSAGTNIRKVDATYKLLTTDIYSSTNASGILINLQGKLLGIIDNSYNTSDVRNILSAIGITELRNLIEVMMSNEKKPYLGIMGIDVAAEAHEFEGVPRGVWVTEVLVDSPAWHARLQMGDIIVRIEDAEITTFIGFVNTLFDYRPGQTINMTIKRQGAENYNEMKIAITAGSLD